MIWSRHTALSSVSRHYRFLLRSCARESSLDIGERLHATIITTGIAGAPETFLHNALLQFYASCGCAWQARKVFDEIPTRTKTLWTGPPLWAALYATMCLMRLFLFSLKCEDGHGCMVKMGLGGVEKACNAVMDMYAKSGLMEGVRNGRVVFHEMPERNEVAWTIMIAGYLDSGLTQERDLMMGRWVHAYALKTKEKELNIMVGTAMVDIGLAMHGLGRAALDIFPQMFKEAKPDDVTFTSVLSACSHSGLVDQGCFYFGNLESVYGITPKVEHYACMVDLLGRAGRLEEAEILVREMPIRPNEVVLGSLLGSCSIHGKLQLGEHLLQELVQLDPQNTEYHILLSNMYALAGKQNRANSLRQVLKKRGIKKVPGMSSIHVGGQVHQFSAGDKSHPRTREVYNMLDEMIPRLRLAGYAPNTALQTFAGCDSLEDDLVEQEEKEQALFSHSEKLAICFGLISTGPGVPLHIFKNLRICQDCHSAIKIVSKIYNEKLSSEIAIVFIVSRKVHVLVVIIGDPNCIMLIICTA
ncbi:Pentatricopeptide repeat-containing protein, mitochondrial [Vitis vinifera]|uniref:Pentatricopeptide repeat-containing protein, mitochondrial n=1 Tax=Vitis vinifera TaxID=29760 RepID=A0A438H962_VITVI|nr:Pentatricopeptide repeat-containing protein, mitochondrial [Vitis vinifera]